MRGVFLIVAISCTFISCNPFEKSDLSKWVQLSTGNYRIQILESYKNYTDNEELTALGAIPVYSHYWRNSASFIKDLGIKSMDLSYFNIPKSYQKKSSEWILDTCLQFYIRQQSFIFSFGRVLENKEVFLNTYPGNSIIAYEDVGKEDSLVVFQQMFIAHSKVYILRANGYKSALNRPLINRFMQSFQLINAESQKKPLKRIESF